MDPSAPGLLRSIGLLADGPVQWGRPIPAVGPGVFVVELPAARPTAPIELTRVGKWLERVESLRLDGTRPTSRSLAARLAAFWLPSQVVLYVVVAFLAQAAIGAALIQSELLAGWVGWFTIIWNLAWLAALPIVSPSDIYYPVLHHVAPLIIGIALLV